MKIRRVLLPLAGALAFAASAPIAAGAAGAAAFSGDPHCNSARATSEGTTRHDGPRLGTMSVVHRSAPAVAAPGRRPGHDGVAPVARSPHAPVGSGRDQGMRIDVEADARLLGASSTPCSGRGPPAAS